MRLSGRNQTIDLLKRLVEVAPRKLQCAFERKIEHAFSK
jgi:hypothetical protein